MLDVGRRRTRVAGAVLAVALLAVPTGAAPEASALRSPELVASSLALTSPQPATCPVGSEQRAAALINAFRAAHGLGALTLSTELMVKAQDWIEYLADRDAGLVHSTLSDGVSPGWSVLLENLGYAGSLDDVIHGLENSPHHRDNLLYPDITEMGIGITRTPDGRVWISEVFAKRAVPSPRYSGVAGLSAYVPITPLVLHATSGRVAAGATTLLQAGGYGPIPSTATSLTVVLEAIDPAGNGTLAFVPPSGAPSAAWHLRVVDGGAAVTAVAPLDSAGRLALRQSISTGWKLTVVGYTSPRTGASRAGRLVQVRPTRLLDTRPASRVGWSSGKPSTGATIGVTVTGRGGVPTSGVSAVVVQVAAAETSSGGWVQAGRSSMVRGAWHDIVASAGGQTRSSLVVAQVDTLGRIAVHTGMSTHLVVDVLGWYTYSTAAPALSGLFVPVRPVVLRDERASSSSAGIRTMAVAGRSSIPRCASGVLGTATVIPDLRSPLQVGAAGMSPWAWSNANGDVPGVARANTVISPTTVVDQGPALVSVGTLDRARVVFSVSGWFL